MELADSKQQNDKYVETITDLEQDCEELKSRIVVNGNGANEKSQDTVDSSFTSSSTVRKLRADLLEALKKVEENAKAHSKSTQCGVRAAGRQAALRGQ